METLVGWKKRRDRYAESEGHGDSIDDFSEQGNVSFITPVTEVKLIKKDETNAEAMKALKIKRWW